MKRRATPQTIRPGWWNIGHPNHFLRVWCRWRKYRTQVGIKSTGEDPNTLLHDSFAQPQGGSFVEKYDHPITKRGSVGQ